MSPVFYIMTIIVRGSRNKPFVNVASFGTEIYANLIEFSWENYIRYWLLMLSLSWTLRMVLAISSAIESCFTLADVPL